MKGGGGGDRCFDKLPRLTAQLLWPFKVIYLLLKLFFLYLSKAPFDKAVETTD